MSLPLRGLHNRFLPMAGAAFFAAAFAFAALAALAFFRLAASFALAAADNFRLAFGTGAAAAVLDPRRNFAHLALCALAIRLRAAALNILRLLVGASDAAVCVAPGNMARSSAICESIRTFCCSNPAMAAVMISGVNLDVGNLFLSHPHLHTSLEWQRVTRKRATGWAPCTSAEP